MPKRGPKSTFESPQAGNVSGVLSYAIVEAPSALGHVPEHLGVERAPSVLLDAGLADGLDARRAGRVVAESYRPERDPQTGILNPRALGDYSSALADAVGPVL